MDRYTLTERENDILAKVMHILKRDLHPKKIILFGSKAKSSAGKSTDFDIAVDAEIPPPQKQRAVLEDLESISGLYKIDLVFMENTEDEFKKIIIKTGKVIYEQ